MNEWGQLAEAVRELGRAVAEGSKPYVCALLLVFVLWVVVLAVEIQP